jgi:hypothetical protein
LIQARRWFEQPVQNNLSVQNLVKNLGQTVIPAPTLVKLASSGSVLITSMTFSGERSLKQVRCGQLFIVEFAQGEQ